MSKKVHTVKRTLCMVLSIIMLAGLLMPIPSLWASAAEPDGEPEVPVPEQAAEIETPEAGAAETDTPEADASGSTDIDESSTDADALGDASDSGTAIRLDPI